MLLQVQLCFYTRTASFQISDMHSLIISMPFLALYFSCGTSSLLCKVLLFFFAIYSIIIHMHVVQNFRSSHCLHLHCLDCYTVTLYYTHFRDLNISNFYCGMSPKMNEWGTGRWFQVCVCVCVTECLLGVETNVAAARKQCTLQRKCSVKGGASTDPASCAVSPVHFLLSSAVTWAMRAQYQ